MARFDSRTIQDQKRRKQALKALMEKPETFFSLGEPYGYGEEEINIAWAAFHDQPWSRVVEKAEYAERQKVRLTPEGKHANILVQRGLAWKSQDTLLYARRATWLVVHAPLDALEIVLIHQGHGWQPSIPLEALVCLKLSIPDATKVGNASGSEEFKFRRDIQKRRGLAEVLQGHKDPEISGQARLQIQACDNLLNGFDAAIDRTSYLAGARNALNVGNSGRWVRILADAEMLHDNRMAYIFPHHHKPDKDGVRSEIEDAFWAVYFRTRKFPHKSEILDELKPHTPVESKDDGYVHLKSARLSHKQIDRRLEGIRKRLKYLWQTGPETTRGRPRKNPKL